MKSLVGIAELTVDELTGLLDQAQAFHDRENDPAVATGLLGKTVLNLFMEPSTRTRLSFEAAAKRLGANVLNFTATGSSVVKGESLNDTLKTVAAMEPDVIVLRHRASGAAVYATGRVRCAVINGGDGRHGHPTQALLDALTVRQAKGAVEGLNVAIVGDIRHSRVARSAIQVFTKLGARVRLGGPRTLVPREFASIAPGVSVARTPKAAVEGADVVMALRVQHERMTGAFFPSTREYARWFGVDADLLSHAKDDAIVMHPGPMNRGVEISGSVADSAASRIEAQVTNGVAVRMAVLQRAVEN